jgi:hypothetical protein
MTQHDQQREAPLSQLSRSGRRQADPVPESVAATAPNRKITKVESATAPPATSPSCGRQPLHRPGGPSRSSSSYTSPRQILRHPRAKG